MRNLRVWTIVALAAFLLACPAPKETSNPPEGPSGQEEPERLTVLTWSDYFGSTTLETFTAATGIEVTVDYIDSNEQMVAKLESQPGQYDLVFPSAYAVEILDQKGMLGRIDRNRLQNAGNLLPAYATLDDDPEGEKAVPYTVSFTAMGVDTSKITSPVSGYAAFLDPEVGKSILLLDDIRATLGMALKAGGSSANSTAAEEVAKAGEFLSSVDPKVHVYASSDLQQLMASGEVALSYAWSGDILQAGRMNPNVEIVLPEEGALLYIDCMAIPKTAERPGNAHALIDHILSSEVAAEISNEILYLTPNQATEVLLNEDAQAIWAGLKELEDNPAVEQVAYIGDAIDLYAEAWNRVRIE